MGIIDAELERQGRNGTDAWNRHQAPADSIMLDYLQQHAMQPIVTFKDPAPHVQHSLNGCYEDRIAALDQLAHAGFVGTARDGSNQQPIRPQRTTNVVFEVDQFALEQLPAGQQRAHLLHVDGLDMNGAIPAQPHHLRDATRVVSISLITHCRQRNAHVTRFDDNDREPRWLQFAIQPDTKR